MHRLNFALMAVSVVFASSVSGCVSPPAQQNVQSSAGFPTILSPSQVKLAQEGMRKFLKDPDSAKFGDKVLGARKPDGTITACGTVNSKNSFGGYVGMSPFIVTIRDGKIVDGTVGSGRDAEFIIIICRQDGVAV
jgi:hypothetical protein